MLALVPSGPANELVSRLRRQLELKHAELQEAKWVIQTMDDAGVALNAKLRGRESDYRDLQDTVEEAHRRLDEQHDREDSLRSELSALKGELQIMRLDSTHSTNGALARITNGNSPGTSTLGGRDSDAALAALTACHEDALADVAMYSSMYHAKEREVVHVRQLLIENNPNLISSDAVEQASTLAAELLAQQDQNARQQEDITALRVEAAVSKREAAALTSSLETLEQELDEMQGKQANLLADLVRVGPIT